MGPSGLIPRPPNWLPGAEAPWAGVPLSRRRRIGLADVRRALSGGPEPTGLSAGQARAVTPHELPDLGDPRPAAVLCLLFEKAGQANVLLTRRAAHLRSHAGEVSFPGGRLRPGEQPLEAALREALEEVGAEVPTSQVVGELTPLRTYQSPALVYCYVAAFAGPGAGGQALRPQVSEVERLFWVPLARLAEEGVFHEELWPGLPRGEGESHRAVPFFVLGEDVVWGATGRLLVELLSRVLTCPWPAAVPER